MSKPKLNINSKIEVIWENEGYKSIIQDLDDESMKISIPVRNGSYLTFEDNEEIEIYYIEDNLSCFTFNCKVVSRCIDNKIALYVLSQPYNTKKIQRRNFVRVPTIEYAFYKHKKGESDWKKGTIVDISGGGLRIKITDKVEINDELQVNLYNDDEKIEVEGVIVRVEKNERKENICGLTFVDLDERTRDKIIKKVFTLMRKQRGLM